MVIASRRSGHRPDQTFAIKIATHPRMHSAPDQSPSQMIAEAVGRILTEGKAAVLATLIEAEHSVGAKLLLTPNGILASNFSDSEIEAAVRQRAELFLNSKEAIGTMKVGEFAPELSSWANARLLFERIEAEPQLVICGAGHVGAALARLGSRIGYRVTLIDDRAEFVRHELFSEESVDLVLAESWMQTVRNAVGNGRGVSVAIVTRGHKEDEECLRAAMSSAPDYVGLIGSKRRTNFVLEKLRAEGVTEAKLASVRAPIGLDIGAVSPEEVALAILAEVVAYRRGGKGTPLSEWRRT